MAHIFKDKPLLMTKAATLSTCLGPNYGIYILKLIHIFDLEPILPEISLLGVELSWTAATCWNWGSDVGHFPIFMDTTA